MKILNDYKELEGKTIAYSHMAQFADQITLATTDGDILMARFELVDYDDMNIRVLNERLVARALEDSSFLREDLAKVGAFDLEAYKEEQRRLSEERSKLYRARKREKELEMLAHLKEKYEND